MRTILCLNNYDVSRFAEDNRPSPDHFLYGLNYLHRRGYRILTGDERTHGFLAWVQRVSLCMHLPISLGDLSRQYDALGRLHGVDLIYSPCDSVVQGLCYLRAIGLLRIPIVCLAHHPQEYGRLKAWRRPGVRWALRGVDAFPSLSRGVADEINRLATRRELSSVLAWGPDLSFYPEFTPPGRGIVSAGRTARDFVTFGRAASQTNSPTRIICPQSYIVPEFATFADHVRLDCHADPVHYSYLQLIEAYAQARAVAIPMHSVFGLCGLTSLVDALGMGRAVVMTRNRLIDIDIEAERIGFWIEPGDVAGWRRAIQYLEDNPHEAEQMGRRARRFAEEKANSQIFGEQIATIIERLLPPEPLGPRSAAEQALAR